MNPTNQPRDNKGRFAHIVGSPTKGPIIRMNGLNYADTYTFVYDCSPEFPNEDELHKEMHEAARGCVWDMFPWISTFGFIATPMKLGSNEYRVTFWVRPDTVQW